MKTKFPVKLLCFVFVLSALAYLSCNKATDNHGRNIGSYSKTSADTIRIDSSIHNTDTGHYEPGIRVDSICQRYIGSTHQFHIYAKFNTVAPPYVWVKVGTTWYGPVPIDFVILPNTNRYHSAWLDGIITGPVFGCLPVRFTYSTNFSSPPFINSTVCPCR